MRGCFVILAVWLLCCGAAQAPGQAKPSPATAATGLTGEVVHTDDGTFLLWQHTPATVADLEMPLCAQQKVRDSFAYRVCNRKRYKLLHYARVNLDTGQSPAAVIAFYRAVLGKQAVMQTAKGTGVVTLAAGTSDNVRLVTITPDAQGCRVRLERVHNFTIPPRIYTPQERRVLRVLENVAQTYRTARHIAYTMEQRNISDSASDKEKTLTCTVDFHRPTDLHLSVTAGTTTVMTINTRAHQLVLTAPGAKDVQRTIGEKLTSALLPELQDDLVVRWMLGDPAVTPAVDYLALNSVAGVPSDRQVEAMLTYPDRGVKLLLFIDLQQKTLLRSETLSTDGDARLRIDRTYQQVRLEPTATPNQAPAVTAPLSTPTGVPAATVH